MSDSRDYDFWVKLASRAAMATAAILIVAKLIAWMVSGSASMLGSLTDSFADGMVSLINFLAIRYAIIPPDEDHKFGHGKAEPLAALAQSVFISGACVFLAVYGAQRLADPSEIRYSEWGIAVSILAIVLTFALVKLQAKAVEATNSTVIEADAMHYRSDLLLNGSVLLALVLAQYGLWWADGLFAIGIALYIGGQSIGLGYRSVQGLLDRELDSETRQRMQRLIEQDPRIINSHDLRTREAGKYCFAQVHITLDAKLSLAEAHAIGDAAMFRVQKAFPDTELLVHLDPSEMPSAQDEAVDAATTEVPPTQASSTEPKPS
ncbi:cation efflux pump FieF [Paraferrimonas sedimenticola]|uniref:Iron transporter n=1 Tax=Paraferrimonas sedimenticola TaxID=375674 RepID=A0AA37RZP4_9GAMM|nr:cation diffusion facilitator family transporter [Paraferrimonas sedimenticola]GLP97597.1 iron transporter [Paraferrimonas sedimenticola]